MKPTDVNRLFQDAFGGKPAEQQQAFAPGRATTPDQHGQLFQDAFRPRGEMPEPNWQPKTF